VTLEHAAELGRSPRLERHHPQARERASIVRPARPSVAAAAKIKA